MNINELVTPANIVAYWDDVKASQAAYMGDFLFPVKKIAGIELNKISGRAGVPVELKASAFDTQATYRDRLSVEVTKQKMAFFRERMKVDEETRQQIMSISNDSILKPYIDRIFDDQNNLIKGAKVTREKMAMQLISTGKIAIDNNGVKLDYDYNLARKQKVKYSTAWSDTENSTPIQDMIDWADDFHSNFYVTLKFAVMNTKTFNYIKKSKSIRAILYPNATNTTAQLVTPAQVKDLIATQVGITILINDGVYATEVGGSVKPFFPDDTVSFLPDGAINGGIGNMIMGTTPEEIDLMANPKFSANTAIVDTAVAVYTRTIDHPVNVETIVSQIALPSFGTDVEGGAGSILIATVA